MTAVDQKSLSDAFVEETNNEREKVEDQFVFNKKIGEGTYGQVFLAKPKNENPKYPAPVYALKMTEIKGHGTWREISVLREIRHANIVKLHKVFFTPPSKMFLLLEYCEYDLWNIIRHNSRCKKDNKELPVLHTMFKSIMHQILCGVEYLHTNLILHRDIKPANILVTGGSKRQRGRVKIADFGFARTIDNMLVEFNNIDPVVVTLWYRAPELLLGTKEYSTAIDVWSIGCMFAELLMTKPIFMGKQENSGRPTPYNYSQLNQIFSVMGESMLDSWPDLPLMQNCKAWTSDMAKNKADYNNRSLQSYLNHEDHRKFIFDMVPDEEQRKHQDDLLQLLLNVEPKSRIHCRKALQHAYFTSDPKPTDDVFAKLTMIPYGPRKEVNQARKKAPLPPQGHPSVNPEKQLLGTGREMPSGQGKQVVGHGNLKAEDLLIGNIKSMASATANLADRNQIISSQQKQNLAFPTGSTATMNTPNPPGHSNIGIPSFQSDFARPTKPQMFPGDFTNFNNQVIDASRMATYQRVVPRPSQPIPLPQHRPTASGAHGIRADPAMNMLNMYQGIPPPGTAAPNQLGLQDITPHHHLAFQQQQDQGRMIPSQQPPFRMLADPKNKNNRPF